MPGIISAYTMGFPPGWFGWEVGQGEDRANAIAERAADGAEAQALVRHGVVSFDALCRQQGVFYAAAVWVPDRSTGGCPALASLELLTGPTDRDASFEDALRLAQAGRSARGFTVFDRGVQEMDLPAGPAICEVTVLAEKRPRFARRGGADPVESRVEITVFPPGCSDILRLQVVTRETDLLEALAEAARTMAESLTVDVGPVP